MGQVRATTIQQRFGFKDGDLKTPKHDEIMLWLNDHALEVVASIVSNEWVEDDISWLNEKLRGYNKPTITLADLPPRKSLGIEKVVWEYPVKSGSYIVGFIDMAVWHTADGISTDLKTYEWEVRHFSQGNLICVEVKTSIPSLGELIRQIRMYQQYQKGTYIVVSPDARFADALRSQGIEFYHYNPDPMDETML